MGDEIGVNPAEIGDDVFVGASAMTLNGAKLGDRAVSIAIWVATKEIPAQEVLEENRQE